MGSILKTNRSRVNILFIAIPIVTIVLLVLPRGMLPLPIHLKIKQLLLYGVILSFTSIIIAILNSGLKRNQRFGLLLISTITTILVCCCWLVWSFAFGVKSERLITSRRYGEHNFHVTYRLVSDFYSGDYEEFAFYKCNKWNIDCDFLWASRVVSKNLDSIDALTNFDEDTDEVHLFVKDPQYRTGKSSRYIESKWIESTPSYLWIKSKPSYLLRYTYGAQPRTYLYMDTYDVHSYYLAYAKLKDYWVDSSPDDIVLLYECEPTKYLCNRLPFQYEIPSYGRLDDFEIFVKKGGLNLWYSNELIYTYGENPQCYVDECTIP